MTRIKRGSVAKKRRKKILGFTKGFRGSHSKLFATANQQIMKALRYSYNDRRKKKSDFKKIWIQRINGASRLLGKNYSSIINQLKNSRILINKKIIAKLSILDWKTFKILIESLD